MLLILGCGRGPADSVIGSDYSVSTSADQESADRLKKAAGEGGGGDLAVGTDDSGDIRNLIGLVAGAGHGGSHSDQITHDIERNGDSDFHSNDVDGGVDHNGHGDSHGDNLARALDHDNDRDSHSDQITHDVEQDGDSDSHSDDRAGDEDGTDHGHD